MECRDGERRRISVAKMESSPSPVDSLLLGFVRPGKPRTPTMSPRRRMSSVAQASSDLLFWICAVIWTLLPCPLVNPVPVGFVGGEGIPLRGDRRISIYCCLG